MISIWDLKRGDLFKVEGSDIILEYVKLDGMYSQALTRDGQMALIGLCKVWLVQGK